MPTQQKVHEGENAYIHCYSFANVSWTFPSPTSKKEHRSNETVYTLSIFNVQITDSGEYTCHGMDPGDVHVHFYSTAEILVKASE